jgi:hypothetical protein
MYLLLTLACAGDTPADDTSTGTDSELQDIVYPSSDKVLIYTGHGGEPGASTGVGGTDDLVALYESEYGFSVDVRSTLGEPAKFRLVILMDPGQDESRSFSEDDIALLQAGLDAGTRLVFVATVGNCLGESINPAVEALGGTMSFAGDNALTTQVMEPAQDHQLTQGIDEVFFVNPCIVDSGSGEAVFLVSRDAFMAAERPARGGDIVLVGDYQWFDDTGKHANGSNVQLARNLVEVDPAF